MQSYEKRPAEEALSIMRRRNGQQEIRKHDGVI
jgi:hypothetical protein